MTLAPASVFVAESHPVHFNTVYVKHEGVPIADCLSRSITIDTVREDESLNITIATIILFQEGKLHQIKWETVKDVHVGEVSPCDSKWLASTVC